MAEEHVRKEIFSKIIQLFVRLTCVFCCVYQMYELSMDYISFDVRTEIKFIKPRKFNIPLIMFSQSYDNLFNYTKIRENKNSKIEKQRIK